MINQQRVRRIKNVIYAVLLLMMVVPAIILIIVGVRMLSILQPLGSMVDQVRTTQVQSGAQAQGQQPQESGYVLEPQDAASDRVSSAPQSSSAISAPARAEDDEEPVEEPESAPSTVDKQQPGGATATIPGNAAAPPAGVPAATQPDNSVWQQGGGEPIPDTGLPWK